MLGSALYYPYIDIEDSKWLRSAILFWNSLQTIVPRAVRDPYKERDTRILWKEGFLDPLRCDLHPELLDTLGKRVIALMDRGSFGQELGLKHLKGDPNTKTLVHADKIGMKMQEYFRHTRVHPQKLSPELRALAMRAGLARMHPEKLSPQMRDLLGRIGIVSAHAGNVSAGMQRLMLSAEPLMDNDGEWLLIDSHFADTYMSALAALLAKETNLAALTNVEPSMAVNLHTLLEDVKPSEQSDKKGALVSFTMKTISIDPTVRVDKLLKFKRTREDQFAELSAQFDDLSSKISNCETGKELEERARHIYVAKIKPKLTALKEELRDSSMQAKWEGFHRAVTISVPGGGAVAYFTGLSGIMLLAAGAALSVTDVLVKSHLAQRKTRRASPYTYLLDVERKLSIST
jgi:hypothetical protein